MAQWSIDKLEISGGYLADFRLQLPSGLICIIGPRGSGKSTLAEAIRLVLGGLPSGAPKSRLDLIKANLGSSVITLVTTPIPDRGGFSVRRNYGQPPILTSLDGRPVGTVELDRGTFLPLDAYSSPEMEGIADETLGAKRRALLDDLCATEMQDIRLKLADQSRSLDSNADSIKAAERRIADITEQIEELGDVKGRLETTPKADATEGSPEFQVASKQRLLNESEATAIDGSAESVGNLIEGLQALHKRSSEQLRSIHSVGESANKEILVEHASVLSAGWANFDQHITAAGAALQELQRSLGQLKSRLAEAHRQQEGVYLTLQQLNQEVALAIQARTTAERDFNASVELAKRLADEKAGLAKLVEERKALKAEFILTRDNISGLRERVATSLQAQAGPKVRLRVQRNADVLEYQQQLMSALHGSKLKNQDDILKLLTRLRPEELAQIIRDDDLAELEAHSSFGKERGRKILDSLKQNINPLSLEIMSIDDAISIELNVSTSSVENYKDASELSRGQKCTALLPLLLARRDTPLVIDQPEDNLDNHFIYQTVVDSILRLKSRRQMIFITHNANIPVLGEAELVVVLNSDGRRGFIEKAGTVDECRKHIIDLLEGGEEAFALRSKRYGA